MTLDSPGVRQQVTDELVKARKQLLSSSYQAIAMNEAKIENFLAQKLVANPNELSGARPAGAGEANSNTAPKSNVSAPANAGNNSTANVNPGANAPAKPAANSPAKPAATSPAKPAANTAGNSKGK